MPASVYMRQPDEFEEMKIRICDSFVRQLDPNQRRWNDLIIRSVENDQKATRYSQGLKWRAEGAPWSDRDISHYANTGEFPDGTTAPSSPPTNPSQKKKGGRRH